MFEFLKKEPHVLTLNKVRTIPICAKPYVGGDWKIVFLGSFGSTNSEYFRLDYKGVEVATAISCIYKNHATWTTKSTNNVDTKKIIKVLAFADECIDREIDHDIRVYEEEKSYNETRSADLLKSLFGF